jgi:hypothetical protein
LPGSVSSVTIPGQFTLDGQNVTLNFSSPDPVTIAAIDGGTSFPQGDIDIGGLSVGVSTGTPVKLGDSARNIAFSFTGGTTYNLQVISEPAAVLKALNTNTNIAGGIDLSTGKQPADRFMLLQLTYNLGATAKGTAAMGAGLTANFGVTGHVHGDWNVVHRFGNDTALNVLGATFMAGRLPRQIKHPSNLAPGTWLITEISGSIALNLGIMAGYDFSWLKKLSTGNLTGDIGVKVALAATASLGFSANGNYSLALSRSDATNKLRLAVYKLKKGNWTFALNASAGVQGVLPASLQDSTDPAELVKAIFGTHATQLLNDLQTVQKVAAGGSMSDQAASYFVMLGQKNLSGVATALELFNEGVDRVNTFVSQLGTLGQRTTSELFAMLSPGTDATIVSDLTTVLTDVKNAAADPTQISAIIGNELARVAFFQTNFGKWLSAVLRDAGQASPLSALKDDSVLRSIGTAANTTLNILDAGDLQTLIDFAAQKLDLKNIPPLPNIDTWLKAKIANFLGKGPESVVQQDLTKVQGIVTTLFSNGQTFWTEAIKAAQKQYEATFVATYESATSDTALLDVEFDFDANSSLGPKLQDAINGNFTEILLDPSIAGVTLNTGVLTHGFHRQSHVELTLPFLDMGKTDVADVLASMTVKHDGGSRVLAYSVKGSNDAMSFISGKSLRDGQMTVVMNIDVPAGVHKASDFRASLGYSLRAATSVTTTRQVISLLTPLVTTYSLPLTAGEVDNWVIDLDKITEQVPTGQIGPSLISLDVAVDSTLPAVWLHSPTGSKDPAYFALSRRIQLRLRSLIPTVYFAQSSRYDTLGSAYPLLVYSSLRPMNSFNINEDDPPRIIASTKDGVYWDWRDERLLTALMFDPTTRSKVLAKMASANQLLTSLRDKSAKFYTPDNLNAVYAAALTKISASSLLPDLLGSMIGFEATFIDAVISAATDLAKFSAFSGSDPANAMKAVSDFSGAIAKTFNQALSSSLFGGDELAALGSALFSEVTLGLAESINITVPSNASPSALFSITIPRANAQISLNDLKAGNYTPDQILVEQKLASALPSLAQSGILAQ